MKHDIYHKTNGLVQTTGKRSSQSKVKAAEQANPCEINKYTNWTNIKTKNIGDTRLGKKGKKKYRNYSWWRRVEYDRIIVAASAMLQSHVNRKGRLWLHNSGGRYYDRRNGRRTNWIIYTILWIFGRIMDDFLTSRSVAHCTNFRKMFSSWKNMAAARKWKNK